ncbi:hypothetical protein [Heliomarina baculiformis]|uniref:hypothetical protein n=1 Tax=Heliomarina baculiformis TaxID=2872036 RepID=UPI001EE1D878|nr:hypothetical protein [Heliomarina baculiformis]
MAQAYENQLIGVVNYSYQNPDRDLSLGALLDASAHPGALGLGHPGVLRGLFDRDSSEMRVI